MVSYNKNSESGKSRKWRWDLCASINILASLLLTLVLVAVRSVESTHFNGSFSSSSGQNRLSDVTNIGGSSSPTSSHRFHPNPAMQQHQQPQHLDRIPLAHEAPHPPNANSIRNGFSSGNMQTLHHPHRQTSNNVGSTQNVKNQQAPSSKHNNNNHMMQPSRSSPPAPAIIKGRDALAQHKNSPRNTIPAQTKHQNLAPQPHRHRPAVMTQMESRKDTPLSFSSPIYSYPSTEGMMTTPSYHRYPIAPTSNRYAYGGAEIGGMSPPPPPPSLYYSSGNLSSGFESSTSPANTEKRKKKNKSGKRKILNSNSRADHYKRREGEDDDEEDAEDDEEEEEDDNAQYYQQYQQPHTHQHDYRGGYGYYDNNPAPETDDQENDTEQTDGDDDGYYGYGEEGFPEGKDAGFGPPASAPHLPPFAPSGPGPDGPPVPPPPPLPPVKGTVDYILIPLILIGLAGPIFVVLYVILGGFEYKIAPIARSLQDGNYTATYYQVGRGNYGLYIMGKVIKQNFNIQSESESQANTKLLVPCLPFCNVAAIH